MRYLLKLRMLCTVIQVTRRYTRLYVFLPSDLKSKMEPLKRRRKIISAVDIKAMEISLEYAIFALEPDKHTELSAFTDAMPNIHLMRCRGWSFRQITRELNDVGMSVTYATVRTYYYRLYPTMAKECERYAKKQIDQIPTPAARDVEQPERMNMAAASALRAPGEPSRAEASRIVAPSIGVGCVRRATDQ
jgi:hypothetical protein